MRTLGAWHYLAICSIPLGIFLSLRFGLYGLISFAILNLVICHFCPDSYLFQKPPDSVNRLSGKQFYKGDAGAFQLLFSIVIFVPIITAFIVIAFSPKEVANFILKMAWLDVVNDNVIIATSYMVDSSSFPKDSDAQLLKALEIMQKDYPRLSLGIIIYRLLAYCFLPVLIAISTFERTRSARSSHNTRKAKPVNFAAHFLFPAIAIVIFLNANYWCSAAYELVSFVNYIIEFPSGYCYFVAYIIILPATLFSIMLCAKLLVGIGDHVISRPQSYFVKHPSAHELYLQSKKTS